MLEGVNSLHLNFATVMKAIAEYLNARLLLGARVRVSSIKPNNDEIIVRLEPLKLPEGGEGGAL